MDGLGALHRGQELGGYVLLRPLGRGGSAVVWEVRDGNGDRFALKLLHPIFADDESMRARLLREARTVNLIRDPGVARVVDLETEGAMAFVVTELIDGVSLREDLAANGPMDFADAREIALSLAQTLDAIHATGVVHRDLKPSNIILGPQRPVLIDFGIAFAEGDERLTRTGLVSGTLGWVCPEVLSGAEPDIASDWWAWSALLVNMLTARPPYGTGNLSAVLSRVHLNQVDLAGIHPQLAEVLRAALAPAAQRPDISTIRERLADLDAAEMDSWNEDVTTALNTAPQTAGSAPETEPLRAEQSSAIWSGNAEPDGVEATALYPVAAPPEPDSVAGGHLTSPMPTVGYRVPNADYPASTEVYPVPGAGYPVGRFEPSGHGYPTNEPYLPNQGYSAAAGYPPGSVYPSAPVLPGAPTSQPPFVPYQYQRSERARVLVWSGALLLTVLPLYLGRLGLSVMLCAAVFTTAVGYAYRWRERRRCLAGMARSDDTAKAFGYGLLMVPKSVLTVAVSAGSAALIAVLAGALWSLNAVGQITPNPVLELLLVDAAPSRAATSVVHQVLADYAVPASYVPLALWGCMVFILAVTRVGPGGWQMSEGAHALASWAIPSSTLRWVLGGLSVVAATLVLALVV